jgi:hypothetical protein|tara:strand:- start:8649 stop:8993 length:345 start_codon:yes stop_codon:yes gene_type:complete
MSRLSKSQTLSHWRELPDQQDLNPDAIPYKHRGTTFGADGLRIEGTRTFVDAILSRIKPLLDGENGTTRLGLNYQQVESKDGKPNDFAGNWVCYVKIHERGHEAQIANSRYGQI